MMEMEQSDPRYLLAKIAKILNQLDIPYIVTGGMAVLVWGRIRFTADIDIVIELTQPKADIFVRALRALHEAGYVSEEAVSSAIQRGDEFNFIDGDSGVKVDFWVSANNEILQKELKRAVTKTVNGQDVAFISPEDLILSKLRWYRQSESTRHLEDIESVIKISEDIIDRKYLEQEAKKQDTGELLKKAMKMSDF